MKVVGPVGSPSPLPSGPEGVTVRAYGAGERAVLSLALERRWPALINEGPAHRYGREELGLAVFSVPELILLAVSADRLSGREAEHLLERIAPITSATLIGQALAVVRSGREGGQR